MKNVNVEVGRDGKNKVLSWVNGIEKKAKHSNEAWDVKNITINEVVSNIWSNIDYPITHIKERVELLSQLLEANQDLMAYMSTRYYADTHGKKNQSGKLSEDIGFNKSLLGFSDYLLEKYHKYDKAWYLDYSLITENQMNGDAKRFLSITYDFDEIKNGELSTEALGAMVGEDFQKNIVKYSERQKKVYRDAAIEKDLYTYPDLLQMYSTMQRIKELIKNKEEYIKEHGESTYYKARRLANAIGYEMSIVRDQLVKPMRIKGNMASIQAESVVNSALEQIEKCVDFCNKEHVFAMFDFISNQIKVKDLKEGKYITVTDYIPIYKPLKDKHRDNVGGYINTMLNEFDENIETAGLTEIERLVVDVVLGNYRIKDDQIAQEKHPFKRVAMVVNKEYPYQNVDAQKVKRWLKNSISKKIANVYAEVKEREEIGVKVCTKCQKELAASERNFGRDKRNKDGLKYSCKKCSK